MAGWPGWWVGFLCKMGAPATGAKSCAKAAHAVAEEVVIRAADATGYNTAAASHT